jgi:hypothetical protein
MTDFVWIWIMWFYSKEQFILYERMFLLPTSLES